MANKSIGQKITNPRETYIDGYGTTREINEPIYITTGRTIYNRSKEILDAIHTFANPGENLKLKNPENNE